MKIVLAVQTDMYSKDHLHFFLKQSLTLNGYTPLSSWENLFVLLKSALKDIYIYIYKVGFEHVEKKWENSSE